MQIQWVSRWDSYLKMEGSQVHWFSIVNSFMVVCFLSGIIFVILLKTVRRDLSQYEEMLTEKGEDIKEDSGWKLVSGDVFRPPPMVLALFFFSLFFFFFFPPSPSFPTPSSSIHMYIRFTLVIGNSYQDCVRTSVAGFKYLACLV